MLWPQGMDVYLKEILNSPRIRRSSSLILGCLRVSGVEPLIIFGSVKEYAFDDVGGDPFGDMMLVSCSWRMEDVRGVWLRRGKVMVNGNTGKSGHTHKHKNKRKRDSDI